MCPNHSAFTKWALKNIKNLQRTQTAGVRASTVPSSYLGQTMRKTSLWGGVQPPRKLTVEVNPVAEPVTRKQGGGVQLSALSPRSRISGFSSEEGSSYSPAPLLLLVGPHCPSCPGSRCFVPPLSLATNPTPWPLLGTDSQSFGRTHLTTFSNRTDELLGTFQVSEEANSQHLCVLLFKTQLCKI